MNEKDLFAYSFDHGFISKAYILNHSVGEITISQDSAKGIMLKENQKTPMVYSFYKENGKWKFCLAAVIGLHELAFKQLVTDSNLSDKDYILKFLESVSGRKAPKTIWNPVK
jgi:hypothetical protein